MQNPPNLLTQQTHNRIQKPPCKGRFQRVKKAIRSWIFEIATPLSGEDFIVQKDRELYHSY